MIKVAAAVVRFPSSCHMGIWWVEIVTSKNGLAHTPLTGKNRSHDGMTVLVTVLLFKVSGENKFTWLSDQPSEDC